MLANPIVRFELVRAARRRHQRATRMALVLLTLLAVAGSLSNTVGWLGGGAGYQPGPRVLARLPEVADRVVLEMVWWQGVAAALLVPGLVAGSIAEEDRRGTMLPLLASPLGSGSILLGKLAARLTPVAEMVIVGLAIALPLGVAGVLDLALILRAYALLLTLIGFVGTLSLLISTVVRQPRRALVAAYLLTLGWLFLPVWSPAPGATVGWSMAGFRWLHEGLRQGHPGETLEWLGIIPACRVYDHGALTWLWPTVVRTFPRVVAIQLGSSAVFLVVATLLLRPLRLEAWRRPGREPAPIRRPVPGDDPMAWKERYAPGRLSRPAIRRAVGVVALLIGPPLVEPAAASFREWRTSGAAPGVFPQARRDLNRTLRQLHVGLYLAGLAVVAALGATSITAERERGTWTGLWLTPLTGREVARAKVAGTLRSARGLAIPFGIVAATGVAAGAVHPIGVVAAAAGLFVFLWFGAAVGVLASMVEPTSDRTITLTALALAATNALALLFIPLDLAGQIAGSWQAIYLAMFTPFIEWASLVSPFEIQRALSGQTWEATFELPGGLWRTRVLIQPGLIGTSLVSLMIHALGAIAATRAAAWMFDWDRAGTQRPGPA